MNLQNSAVVFIDMQNGVIAGNYDVEAVLSNVNTIVAKARSAGIPVIWAQQTDSDLPQGSNEWELVPSLDIHSDDARIEKAYGDAFAQTKLKELLDSQGASTIVFAGAQSHACLRCTWHSALVQGYNAVLIKDAHTTEDISYGDYHFSAEKMISFLNFYAEYGSVWPLARGTAITTKELTFTDK